MGKLLMMAGLILIGFSSCRDYGEQNIRESRATLREVELAEDTAEEQTDHGNKMEGEQKMEDMNK
jgi:hypothetical protein